MKKRPEYIAKIVCFCNRQLERTDLSQEVKSGICIVVEEVLFRSGTYHGFAYHGWINGGCERWMKDGQPENVDDYMGPKYDRSYY